MITHAEARKIVLDTDHLVDTEIIDLYDCVNRVLAVDAISSITMPPFDKAMVDGYACKRKDIDKDLIIDGVISAGESGDEKKIIDGHCYKIMTGAPIPSDTDMVVMVEETEISDGKLRILNKISSDNISPKGEDIKIGDRVLKRSTLLKPVHCGILAALGMDKVEVFKKIKIGIIITGDEIIEPGNKLKKAQIYNSNGAQLINYCHDMNAIPDYYGIAEDSYAKTEECIRYMISRNDMLIITGGVSMGDYDYVAPAIRNSGLEVKFESVAAQPGRPLVFATDGKKFCFGMPGNPISGVVMFETIIKPLLYKISGTEPPPTVIPLKLAKGVKRKKAVRKSYYPVILNNDHTVSPIDYHGSAHINSYSDAFGIIAMEIGEFEKKAGDTIHVRQI
jgi:molybdopterin molybdotransferase